MSDSPNKKPRESTPQPLNVFDTIDIHTGRYFSLGVYPHLPHTPTTEPTEHAGHVVHSSSLLPVLEGANAPHSMDVAHGEDIEHAGQQPIAQSAAAGGRAGGGGLTVDHPVSSLEEGSPVMEEFLLGQGHSGMNRKGDDKAVIFQESNEESPVPKEIDPSAPVQGNSSETPDAGETGKWTKSR